MIKILVRNLDRSTDEAGLEKCFKAFGEVRSCTVVTDKGTGASKGFGFVTMAKPGDAKAAIKRLNNTELDGSRIRVKKSESKGPEPEPASKPSTDGEEESGS